VRRSLVLLLPLLPVAGCGAATTPAEEVAAAVETLLEEQAGVRPEVVCPDEVRVEEGASTRCTLTAGDDPTEYGVTVTVETVEDDEPTYLVAVDRDPLD
jgi:hypothetical protein